MKTTPLTRRIRFNRLAGFAAWAILICPGAFGRTWTSADGKQQFEGELKAFDARSGVVSVTKPDGKVMSYYLRSFSAADSAYIRENSPSAPPVSAVAGARVAQKVNADPKSLFARHDGKPADMKKPVQVFILLGQSNMVGMGKITGGMGLPPGLGF